MVCGRPTIQLSKRGRPHVYDYEVGMTIFRHVNGKLYTLELVKRRMFTEAPWLCATPYLHTEIVKRPLMSQFVAVSFK